MNILVSPSKLSGNVTVPGSKSASHRAIICSALSKGASTLNNVNYNDDIIATIEAAKAIGARFEQNDTLKVIGIKEVPQKAIINCKESGSTLRFFAPIVSALGITTEFFGEGRLPERPMEPLLTILKEHGIKVSTTGKEMFTLSGKLNSGEFSLPGDISSQYITGLLFALPILEGDSTIKITTKLESKSYINMTIDMLSNFGITITETMEGYLVKGGQKYKPKDIMVEGDYSGAAFWLGASALGHNIAVKGVALQSSQGDKAITDVLKSMNSRALCENDTLELSSERLYSTSVDASDIPDLIPILALVAAFAKGKTSIYNAKRLIIKESNRLVSTAEGINNLGGKAEVTNDGLIVTGKPSLKGGGIVDSFSDHRIAMSMIIGAINCQEPTTILETNCITKSYPDFLKDFKSLGGKYNVL